MVVSTNGKPDKNQYRRFKIKTPLDEANDFLSMQEVMSRRCALSACGRSAGSKPDLIISDAQAAAVRAEMPDAGESATLPRPGETRLPVPR